MRGFRPFQRRQKSRKSVTRIYRAGAVFRLRICSNSNACAYGLSAVVISLVALSGIAQAQDPVTENSAVAEIAAAAKASAEQLEPDRIADIDATRAEFLAAADNLRQHLARTASAGNAEAWLSYLELQPVLDAIESEAREVSIAVKSTRVSQKATGLHAGLEVSAVRRLRSAAQDYSNALRFRSKERTTEVLARQLVKFSDDWSKIESTPTPDEVATLQFILDFLERTDQQVALVQQATSRYSSANIHVTVDDELIYRSVNRFVNQCSPVRDCILGTRIIGSALLTGDVAATLLPSTGSVRLQIALNGTVNSNNIGYNGPVKLRTSGDGVVFASRTLEVNEAGIEMDPVVASASLNTRINSIEHPLGLVRRIAKKKAAQQKHMADRIAHGKLISKLKTAFAEETDSSVQQPDSDVMGQFRSYLQRLDFSEPSRSMGSTSESVFLYATIRKANQLAAPTPAPPIAEPNEATVQVHESVVNNTIGSILAGRTMTRSELQDLVSKAGRDENELSVDDDQEKPNFEIDFSPTRPIIFEARDGKIRVGIRGTRFAEGARELKAKLEIVAVYQPVKTESGDILLDRVGETQINFPGTKRLSVAQAGIRGSIKKGVADAFPKVLMDQPWTVPATVKAPALQGRTYRPRYFDAQDGWLTLGVDS